ncbi:MAG: D-lactate dehydrogenase VanH-B [Bifidobacteriaceae bacterium]|nr:D-lactate dehydrogenase VanH-B [Bifidobacteriaceae bacterium]
MTAYGCDPDEAALLREMAPRFGVLPTITRAPASAATAGLVSANRCVSVGHKTTVTNDTLLALRQAGAEYLSTRSVGCDHIDVGYAAAVGLRVGTVAYSPDAVADYTLMLMLMILRDAESLLRRTAARDYRLSDTRGRELRDLTVGVIGTGRIGVAVVGRLRGFGCQVLAHDIHPRARADYVPLRTLLHQSDIVTLHTPLTADTHHLLDAERIHHMKSGALLVNTARGALVDTGALLAALERGHLGGAALDVLEGEEELFYADHRGAPGGSDPLRRLQALPGVLISPHTAYYTDHALRDIVENTLINCVNYESEARRHGRG